MDTSRRTSARPLAVIAALLLAVLSMGGVGSAAADPGNGKSGGAAQASAQGPPAQSGKATSDQASSAKSASKSTSEQAKPASGSGSAKPAKSGGAAKDGKSGSSDHSQGNAGTTGSYDAPQPPSKADQNSGGANGQCPGGPYCSTRDGSPSLNGSPQGKAKGKPCAGCVGKADNKNPQGQKPGGSDKNAGYECDRNHGIGRSNPAHTGCVTTPPPGCENEPSYCPPPPGCENEPSYCPPPPGCESEPSHCPPPPDCRGEDERCDWDHGTPHRPPVVLGIEASRHPRAGTGSAASAGVLPATGAGATAPLLLGGTALVAAGSALMARRRKGLAP